MDMMADDNEDDSDEGTRETMALYDNDDELIISFCSRKDQQDVREQFVFT